MVKLIIEKRYYLDLNQWKLGLVVQGLLKLLDDSNWANEAKSDINQMIEYIRQQKELNDALG